MIYTLIEEYFETSVFQNITQLYFDTILQEILVNYPITEAKGLFMIDNKVCKDDYDMPYHIHILNGLIPSLFIYEKYLLTKGWIENSETEIYIKAYPWFTFHDANKLLKTKTYKGIKKLDETIDKNSVLNFS